MYERSSDYTVRCRRTKTTVIQQFYQFIPESATSSLTMNVRKSYIGRRTGKDVLAGKIIRRDSKGFENFDDYFSEEETDSSDESTIIDKSPAKSLLLTPPTNFQDGSSRRCSKHNCTPTSVPRSESRSPLSTSPDNCINSVRKSPRKSIVGANPAVTLSPSKSDSLRKSILINSVKKKANSFSNNSMIGCPDSSMNSFRGSSDDEDTIDFSNSSVDPDDCSRIIFREIPTNACSSSNMDAESPVKNFPETTDQQIEISDSDSENGFCFHPSKKQRNPLNNCQSVDYESVDDKIQENVTTVAKNKKAKEGKKVPIYRPEVEIAENENALRRSKRTRLPPLEHWKHERPIYKRTKSGVMTIVGIQSPLNNNRNRLKHEKGGRRKANASEDVDYRDTQRRDNYARQDTFSSRLYDGTNVIDSVTGEEVVQKWVGDTSPVCVQLTSDESCRESFIVSKLLGGEQFSSGFIRLKPGGMKSRANIGDDTIQFSICKGKVEVVIHETAYILKACNMFGVPTGNAYSIKNLSTKTDAILQYTLMKGPSIDSSVSDSD